MRADRLLSLLMMLKTRGRMTAQRLSDELEVSIRTIYRDVYALRVAGFPVTSERGLGGGCSLHEDYRMRLTDLTQDELSALFTMAVPAPLVELGVGQDAKGALLKLAAALPAARRNVEQFVRHRIYLDPQTWRPASAPALTLALLREGVWADQWMKVTFRRMRSIHTVRDIAPFGLVAKETKWHLIWAGRDDLLHVDRASAIVEATMLEERFERPSTFDLSSYWNDWSQRQASRRRMLPVHVKANCEIIPSLIRELGTECVECAPHTQTTVSAHLIFEHLLQARSILLQYGAAVEVITPKALRQSIADFGAQIASIYSQS